MVWHATRIVLVDLLYVHADRFRVTDQGLRHDHVEFSAVPDSVAGNRDAGAAQACLQAIQAIPAAARDPAIAGLKLRLRREMQIWVIMIHASAEAMDFSTSLASLRHLPSHANVRSTTHRRGRTSKPLALSVRLMISMVQPDFLQPAFQLVSRIAAIGEDVQ